MKITDLQELLAEWNSLKPKGEQALRLLPDSKGVYMHNGTSGSVQSVESIHRMLNCKIATAKAEVEKRN